jgi:ribosomal protein RSM22 (predicted rRNA methylase)
MIPPALPADLRAGLDAKLHGLSRSDAAARSATISETYRRGGGSAAIRSETDALAYGLARMPATYAAVAACLNALREVRPDFAPESLLDIGAGPGTATWAAAESFASLATFTSIDANAALRTMALELFGQSPRLAAVDYMQGGALVALANAKAADLVVASYVVGEINDAGAPRSPS